MRAKQKPTIFHLTTILTLSISMLMAATAFAMDKLPETSHDGLKLQKDTKLAAVYLL